MAYSRRSRHRRAGRRVSVAKVKYQKPSARNQKAQILSNKLQLNKLARTMKRNVIYTDWALTNNYGLISGEWFCQPLNSPGDWSPMLRTSASMQLSQSSFFESARVYFALYGTGIGTTHANLFIVSPASESADRNPFVSGPAIYKEYIASTDGAQCITLNRDVFKVHHHKSILLTTVDPGIGIPTTAPVQFPGDPRTTYYKWGTGYKAGFKIAAPTGLMDTGGVYQAQNWRTVQIEQLPYSRRFYFICLIKTDNPGGAQLYWHQHVVMKNSD